MSKYQYIVDGLIKSQEIASAFIHDVLSYEKEESHWAKNSEKIPPQYRGYCFRCWGTKEHMVKDFPVPVEEAIKPPWLTIQEYQVLQKLQL
ncbi:33824_t:CDS:2 [Gigaspora margarita]|uniref:33824_t:CDS:1 n=1 Tax=Gigaspora margarita TaxID=4874 RepID=A0ABN7VPP3_GIGMA|nr:33824_t:CDS:2 [Gigaspora margarita]